MNWLIRHIKRRRLAKAREDYAKWKGRLECLQQRKNPFGPGNSEIEAAGEVAKLEERVEQLMREV